MGFCTHGFLFPNLFLLRPLYQVTGDAHEEHAAEDVPDGDRNEIVQAVQRGQLLQLLRGDAVHLLRFCGIHRIGGCQNAGGDIEHVGDAVLEATHHKGQDREENGPDLTGDVGGGTRHQHRDADQNIAEDAGAESPQRCNGNLSQRHLDGIGAQQTIGIIEISRIEQQHINEQCPQKIAEIDNAEAADTTSPADLTAHDVHHHETVAGEELAAHKNNHHEAHGKDAPGQGTGNADISQIVHRGAAGGAAQGNEGARHDPEKDHLADGQLGLPLAALQSSRDHLCRGIEMLF